MKSILVALFGMLSSNLAFGSDECYQKLTKDFSVDSSSYHVGADFDSGSEPSVNAQELVRRALVQAGCDPGDAVVNYATCREIVPNSAAIVCYVESDIGFFYTAKDMVDTANVIFNRWD